MGKAQYIAVGLAALLFVGLYFGFDTQKPKQQTIDLAQSLSGTSVSPSVLMDKSRAALTAEQQSELSILESSPIKEGGEEVDKMKTLAGWWVRAGFPEASGYLAEKIAELENTPRAWSIAGATFQMALQKSAESVIERPLCAEKAVSAMNKAIELEPDNPEHQVNLALIYADAPPEDNPMHAVLLLRDLEKNYPSEPSVYNALGRLGIKTGQWDRAILRLEKAVSLAPDNKNALCLLAKAYEGKGDIEKAKAYAQKCAKAAQ